MQYHTHSAAETEQLAQQLLPEILNKRIIQLSGNLGSGKTTFVKGLAKALGIEEMIKSPTYTYVNRYEIKKQGNKERSSSSFPRFLVHYDLYRLPEFSDHPDQVAASIGLSDALHHLEGLVIIEWPERLPLNMDALRLNFKKTETYHEITIS